MKSCASRVQELSALSRHQRLLSKLTFLPLWLPRLSYDSASHDAMRWHRSEIPKHCYVTASSHIQAWVPSRPLLPNCSRMSQRPSGNTFSSQSFLSRAADSNLRLGASEEPPGALSRHWPTSCETRNLASVASCLLHPGSPGSRNKDAIPLPDPGPGTGRHKARPPPQGPRSRLARAAQSPRWVRSMAAARTPCGERVPVRFM